MTEHSENIFILFWRINKMNANIIQIQLIYASNLLRCFASMDISYSDGIFHWVNINISYNQRLLCPICPKYILSICGDCLLWPEEAWATSRSIPMFLCDTDLVHWCTDHKGHLGGKTLSLKSVSLAEEFDRKTTSKSDFPRTVYQVLLLEAQENFVSLIKQTQLWNCMLVILVQFCSLVYLSLQDRNSKSDWVGLQERKL